MKLEKILLLLSISIQTFNVVLFLVNSIRMNLLGNWFVLLGAAFFTLQLIASFFSLYYLTQQQFSKSGWILLLVGFAQIGTNSIFNILSLINIAAGTLLVVKNIKLKARGAQ